MFNTRVSTTEQANEGYSLEFQNNRLIEHCKQKGINNYKLLEEQGFSGKNANRPQIIKLINYIKNDDVDKLIFFKIDRISRNIMDYQKIVNLCFKHNVEMISLSEQITTSAMGKFSQNLFISLAQMEREQISERTKNGYIGMLQKGEYPFGGRLPLGISVLCQLGGKLFSS